MMGKASIPHINLGDLPRIPPSEGRFAFCPSPRKVLTKPAEKEPSSAETIQAQGPGGSNVQILKEDMDPNYEPTQEEVEGYAEWLGMDLATEQHLLWLARAALKEPCPAPWKPCRTDEDGTFYFNFRTGESIWDHPSDVHYRQLYEEQKAKNKAPGPVPSLCLAMMPKEPIGTGNDVCRSPRKLTARARQEATVAQRAASADGEAANKTGKATVLDECLDPDYEPAQEELEEYAAWLGMDLEADRDLFWIARAGLKETCPEPWKPCQTESGDIFYFNFKTGDSIWDHPCDQHYKDLYQEHKRQKSS
eukprot:TRINITY_DN48582_c0_g1_i1.p1 TRINITY_DN48582_c0_g1~~TRINITY_DN48582_c0_g1_i1.p1  ORF type:complete len:306 (-),score=64.87 TRINITY_DN48582_c0_g1_i1:87-1004(-)